jgi:tetratricopeptide (TPR) repeat protein
MRLRAGIIVFLLMISTGFAFAAAEDFVTEGDYFYEKFDNLKALEKYEKAYSLDPDNYDVLLRLARTYNDAGEEFYEMRKMEEAESYINKGVKFAELFKNKFPDSAAAYTYMAMAYGNLALFKGGNEKVKLAKKIEENAKRALNMDPDNHVNYIILGIYNRELASLSWLERAFANTFFGSVPQGSYEESERLLRQALKIDPDMIVATYQLAKTYRKMDKEQQELQMLKKVTSMKQRDFRDKFAKAKAKRRVEELSN